jgi:hypothetical protein
MLSLLLALLMTHPTPRCDVVLVADGNTAAIQTAMDRADNPTICLRPGKYTGARFVVRRSSTLRREGVGEVVLDAAEVGRVFTLPAPDVHVTLVGLTLTGGRAEQGGAVEVSAAAHLQLEDCIIRDNVATFRSGGGLHASAGQVVALRTRWTHNLAPQGAAVSAQGQADVRLVANVLTQHPTQVTDTATLYLSDAARLELASTTVAFNAGPSIAIAEDLQAMPELRVRDSILLGAPDSFHVAQRQAEHVDVQRTVVSGRVGFVSLDLASRREPPQLDALGAERAVPVLGSPAIDLARCTSAEQKRDLTGKVRSKRCTAGSLEPSVEVVAHTRWLRKHKRP